MAEIPLPTSANIIQFQLALDERQQVNRSDWTGRRKVTALPGAQRWVAQFNPHVIYNVADRKEWRAFLIALRGQANTFRLPVAPTQRTGVNPTVLAGATAGDTLPMQGLPLSATALDAGDYMTVPLPSGHQRLVMLTAPLVADGGGQATAQFRPFLNEVPATGASIETIEPFCLMSLVQAQNGWQERSGGMEINFDAEEAL